MENEFDEADIDGLHPETLEERTPSIITYIFSLVSGLFSVYGWIFLFGSIVCFFLWRSWSEQFERWRESAEYHKNPDKFVDRENALQAARQKMQEEYEEKARKRAEKLKEEQELKRANASASPPPKVSCDKPSPDKKPKTLRTGFNPLMSDTRSGYRTGRRSGGG